MFWIILIFGLIHLLLSCIAFFHIRNSDDKIGFVYRCAFLLGDFIWEDVFVFSGFTFLVAMFLLVVHDIRFGLVIFAIFWIVRCMGETLYFFFQQFHKPTHFPHAIGPQLGEFFGILFGKISDQKAYILMQVFHQVLTMIAATVLVFVLKYWDSIPPWFNF